MSGMLALTCLRGWVTMPWMLALAVSLALPVAAGANQEVVEADVFGFRPLLQQQCQPSCSIDPNDGQVPFALSYKIEEKSDSYAVELTLNNDTFRLEVADHVIRRGVLPFHYYHFPGIPHRIYGLDESTTASGFYNHYFVRDGEEFHYLGLYGPLSYDTAEKLFVVLEPRGAPSRLSYYKLDANRFHCVEGQCNGVRRAPGLGATNHDNYSGCIFDSTRFATLGHLPVRRGGRLSDAGVVACTRVAAPTTP